MAPSSGITVFSDDRCLGPVDRLVQREAFRRPCPGMGTKCRFEGLRLCGEHADGFGHGIVDVVPACALGKPQIHAQHRTPRDGAERTDGLA